MWEVFYQNNITQYSPPLQKQEDLPIWHPVSVKEMHSLISKLKKGEAPGLDLIPTELLIENVTW